MGILFHVLTSWYFIHLCSREVGIYRISGCETAYKKSSLVYNRRATQKEKNVPRYIVRTNVAVSYHFLKL